MKSKNSDKRLLKSVEQAKECAALPLVERLRSFGFTVRYDGKIVGQTPCLSASRSLMRASNSAG